MVMVPNPYDMTGTLDTTRNGSPVPQDVSQVSVAFTMTDVELQEAADARLQPDQRMAERTY